MDQYQIEWRTAPVPVIALVKNKRLHDGLITCIQNNISRKIKILSLENENEIIKPKSITSKSNINLFENLSMNSILISSNVTANSVMNSSSSNNNQISSPVVLTSPPPLQPSLSSSSITSSSSSTSKDLPPLPSHLLNNNPTNRFEGTKPAGIFKRGWFKKHQELIPSVCVIIVHWKSDEHSTWRAQESEIAKKILAVKETRTGKNTKFVAIIVTKKSTPVSEVQVDPNTYMSTDDFIYNVRKAANLDSKNIILMKESEISDDQSFKTKLTKPIKESIVNYYKEQMNMVKKFKSDINKTTQPYYFVRHRMKVAFYYDILMNSGLTTQSSIQKMIKYLTQAYTALQNVSTTDFLVEEIKTLGDMLNFKLCFIKLSDKKIDMAVKQFLKHISWYKLIHEEDYSSSSIDQFKFHARVYLQYRMMGEILERIPPNLLSPDQRYQNPGFYYQAAATHAKYRKTYASNVCDLHKELVDSIFAGNEELLTKIKIEDYHYLTGYYGKVIEMPELSEKLKGNTNGINIRNIRDIARELILAKHSETIIQMLTNAYNHFNVKKDSQLKRMMYYIASSIASEHYESGNYEKSKVFFDKIAKHYRKEQWYELLTVVLQRSLECSKQLKLSKQFVLHALELISTLMTNPLQEKHQHLNDLLLFINTPDQVILPPLSSPVVIDMDSKNVLFQLKTQFSVPFASVYQPIQFSVQITSYIPSDLRISSLTILFSDKEYNIHIQDGQPIPIPTLPDAKVKESNGVQQVNESASQSGEPLDLVLKANCQPCTFNFPLIIKQRQDLQCLGVSLSLKGPVPNQEIRFQWKFLDNEYFLTLLKSYDYRLFYSEGLFVERPVVIITEPEPNLSLSFAHLPPALVNEYYSIKITLHSNDDHVTEGRLVIDNIPSVEITHIYQDELVPLTSEGIKVPEIVANGSYSVIIFLKCEKPGINKLQCRVSYGTKLYPQLERSTSFDVSCQYPFDSHFHFMATRQAESKIVRDEQRDIVLNENEMMFRLLPSQRVSFYQKIISNVSQNISVSDPFAKDKTQSGFSYLEGFSVLQAIALQTSLKCTTPYSVNLEEVSIDSSDKFMCMTSTDYTSTLYANSYKTYLEDKDEHSSCFVIVPREIGKNVPVGNIRIALKRAEPINIDEIDPILVEKFNLARIEYSTQLPPLNIIDPGVTVSFCSPFEAFVGTSIKCSLIVENNTPQVQQVQLFVSENPTYQPFFYSGTTNLRFSILPYQSRELVYNFVPIMTGLIEFPKFSLGNLKKQVHILNDDEKWTIYIHEKNTLPETFNMQ
ncbi:hypothetical protein NAEGRDRAFT_78691 [Naegleria gruberi]|uniref:Trafficking protein particle complex subunit 11 n=1 Tax=Naegleria gruberi TaxID=5762 RepID=D2V5R7_NAEGR|nr:uncharacterized protein NAEGRDRAFT_78691 [Naegleria gruberi]EFC47696.1 hypothetical protein NAEGRDRAFT_78691 [Naegleria gruberi]|eukprot:XP_002680440.1 hypothetical protein NAEGRDRAFT_78691 [Naegleria gruberi strain NEG-M]